MPNKEVKKFGEFVSKMDYLLQEGVVFSVVEIDLLEKYNSQLNKIIDSLNRR